MRHFLTAVLTALATLFVAVTPAWGAFPGANGRIAFDDFANIRSINPDGTGEAQLTTAPNFDYGPEWSPDGQRITFTRHDGSSYQVYVMNADGSGLTQLTSTGTNAQSSWSPDGQRIAFGHNGELWVMDADGSDQTPIGNPPVTGGDPEWSPDGSRIAFVRNDLIHWVRPDGNDITQVTSDPPICCLFQGHSSPEWSPDGKRIAYVSNYDWDGENCYDLRTVNPDGSGDTAVFDGRNGDCDAGSNYYAGPGWSPDGQRIASNDVFGVFTARVDGTDFQRVKEGNYTSAVDWQPLPNDNPTASLPYVRPKGATPAFFPLVPAYNACTATNRTHGPPLAFPSCNPPQPGSPRLMIGVGDGSPAFARGAGFMRVDVQAGAPGPPDDSDVHIRFRLENVMRTSDLSEYTGEVRPTITVRRTDRDPPTPAPIKQTTMDFAFAFTVPCVPTPSSNLDASLCLAATSVNALVPGAIKDGNRSMWAFDKLRVYDGGPDENADTQNNNSLFMTQGVFVP